MHVEWSTCSTRANSHAILAAPCKFYQTCWPGCRVLGVRSAGRGGADNGQPKNELREACSPYSHQQRALSHISRLPPATRACDSSFVREEPRMTWGLGSEASTSIAEFFELGSARDLRRGRERAAAVLQRIEPRPRKMARNSSCSAMPCPSRSVKKTADSSREQF